MALIKGSVEVGRLEKCEDTWILESRFFPSKVGGKPAWLDLKNISIDISCEICSKPCVFLCQVYAPVEDEINPYHRTIYIFVCQDPECCTKNSSENFKVFRCQLPKVNDFYVPEEPEEKPDWHPESSVERFNTTCYVCGCLGSYQCGKCKSIKYCSKNHQILDWRSGHKEICSTKNKRSENPNILFPEYEIIIGEEMEEDDCEIPEKEKSDEDRLKEYRELVNSGKAGTLMDVDPDILEMYASGKEDKYFKHFKLRLRLCPDQVVRYDKGGEPLWIAEPNLKSKEIPDCEICGGPRQFEFQVLSTLLNYLNVDSLGKSLDWGNLLIYTCKSNCMNGPSYKKEFLWKQDIE